MSTDKSPDQRGNATEGERRQTDRDREELDWESKVVGRLNGRLKNLPSDVATTSDGIGWEASVLDTLRRRIERGPN